MSTPEEPLGSVHQFLKRVFIDDLHARHTVFGHSQRFGWWQKPRYAVSLMGQASAQARRLSPSPPFNR